MEKLDQSCDLGGYHALLSFFFLVSYFLQMSLKHTACYTFRASDHLRWDPFGGSFLIVFSMFFLVFGK